MDYDEKNLFDNCRFVADVMKTRQDLRFQALRLFADIYGFRDRACRGVPYPTQ